MGDSLDPLLWILPAGILVVIDAMQMAYSTAVNRISDSELESGHSENREGDLNISSAGFSRIMKARDNILPLSRSVWFWQILTASAGTAACSMAFGINRFATACMFAAAVYIFGAALPHLMSKLHPLKTALRLSGPCTFFTAVSLPFTAAFSFIAGLPLRMTGKDPDSLDNEVTEDEILSMVNEGHEQGSIDEDEAEMISNIFELDDKQADDIMTHRAEIDAFESSVTLDQAIRHMVDAPNSRFPVYEGSIDNIIGALYLKDAMLFHMKEQFNDQSIGNIMHLLREVKFIPETVYVDELFRQMQESRKQMAIVINEYGETSGLVTMEDILEEIVGNILDEYDHDEKLIARSSGGRLRINGKALLEDVGKFLGRQIEHNDYDTLSGYLTEKLGHIPTQDDRGYEIKDKSLGYCFRILSVQGTVIGWLDVSKMP